MKTKITITTLAITLLSFIKTSAQLTANAGSNQTICNGSSVTIGGSPTATGGTGTYTYIWSPASGLSSTSVANPTASPTATTTYTVVVVSGASTVTSSVMITVNPLPTVNPVSNQEVCNGGMIAPTIFSSSTSGATFAWTNSLLTIGLSASGTGNIASFIAHNTSSTSILAAVTVTPTGPASTFCVGLPY